MCISRRKAETATQTQTRQCQNARNAGEEMAWRSIASKSDEDSSFEITLISNLKDLGGTT